MKPNGDPRRTFSALMIGVFLFVGGCATKPAREPSVATQPVDDEYKIGKRFTLHSDILHEDRNFWVYLPRSYQNTVFAPKQYPVLYILDGDAHFHSASGAVQFMSDGNNGNTQIPELIVVAIPNTFRTRDLTPTHTTKSESGKQEPSLASSGGKGWFLLPAFTLGRVSWCQVASSERIRNRYHDQLRNLGVAIVSIAHELHCPAGGMKVGISIQNVEHGVLFGGENRILIRSWEIYPEIPVLMEDVRVKRKPLPNFVFVIGWLRCNRWLPGWLRGTSPNE